MLSSAPSQSCWEAGIVPLATARHDDPRARPAVVMVAEGDTLLGDALLPSSPSEPADVAAALAGAVRRAGRPPRTLRVRHGSVTRELPEGAVRDLFQAAAAFHRAAPWRFAADFQFVDVDVPEGASWTTSIRGYGRGRPGLGIGRVKQDFLAMSDEPVRWWHTLVEGPAALLTYADAADLTPEMRDEVLAARWPVAGTSAYPVLSTVNTPGGGASPAMIRRLTRSLHLLVPFFQRHADAFEIPEKGGNPYVEWRDPASGATLRHDPEDPEVEAWLARDLCALPEGWTFEEMDLGLPWPDFAYEG